MKYMVTGILVLCMPLALGQTLGNSGIRLDFDLETGTYDVRVGRTLALDGACAMVEGWSSADAECQRRVVVQTDNRMLIECVRPNAPAVLLEHVLYPEHVELRAGIGTRRMRPS
jgi:hypothetical protein